MLVTTQRHSRWRSARAGRGWRAASSRGGRRSVPGGHRPRMRRRWCWCAAAACEARRPKRRRRATSATVRLPGATARERRGGARVLAGLRNALQAPGPLHRRRVAPLAPRWPGRGHVAAASSAQAATCRAGANAASTTAALSIGKGKGTGTSFRRILHPFRKCGRWPPRRERRCRGRRRCGRGAGHWRRRAGTTTLVSARGAPGAHRSDILAANRRRHLGRLRVAGARVRRRRPCPHCVPTAPNHVLDS